MTVNVTDYMNKFQEEGLKAIKQTQDASLKAMSSFQEFTKEFSENPAQLPDFKNVPTPTQFVEMSFGFASQLLEMRKAYTLKIAEMLSDTQKQAEANFKAATQSAATPGSNGNLNPNPNVAPNKPVAK